MGFFKRKKRKSATEMKSEIDALRSRRENEEYDRKLRFDLAKEKRLARERSGFGRFSKGVKKAVRSAAEASRDRSKKSDGGLFSQGLSSGLFDDDKPRKKGKSRKKDDDVFDKWGIR